MHSYLEGMDFSGLKELDYVDTIDVGFRTIIKKATNLEKVRWFPYEARGDSKGVLMKHFRLVMKFKSLKYLELVYRDMSGHYLPEIVSILDVLEHALIRNHGVKRDIFKIRIHGYATNVRHHKRVARLLSTLERVARLLNNGTKHFMIELKTIGHSLHTQDEWLNFQEMRSNFWVSKGEDDWYIITNKECKICGIRESWMMDCSSGESI